MSTLLTSVSTFFEMKDWGVKCVVIHYECDWINQTVVGVLSTPDFYRLTDCLQKSLSWSCYPVQRVGQVHEPWHGPVHDWTYPLFSELCFQNSLPYILKHSWGLKTMKATGWKGPVVTLSIEQGEARTYAIYRTVSSSTAFPTPCCQLFCRPGKV